VAVARARLRAPAFAAPTSRFRGRGAQVSALVALMIVGYLLLKNDYSFPASLTWDELPRKLDDAQDWLLEQRTEGSNPFFALLDAFRSFSDWLVTALLNALEWFTWVGTLAASVLIVLRFGGWRAALIVFGAFVSFALLGLWEESIQTLALMTAAVLISLLIGVPIGILAGRNERFHRGITPILDAMQIVPAFAYLMPVVIVFSVGPAAAMIVTLIYAIPPAIRITALGIRGVTPESVEASQALGATPTQTLFKVQLPLARRQLLLALNQTIMFALSIVVIAGLIGGKGLGDVVTNGLYSNPALAVLAGVAIVIMAIALDRATAAIADRTDPARRQLTDEGRRRARNITLGVLGLIALIVLVARALGADAIYPDEFETASTVYDANIQSTVLGWINDALEYIQDPTSFIFGITDPVGNFILERMLQPIQNLLMDTPWFVVLGCLTVIAYVLSGLRPAVTAFLMLAVIGIMGVWEPAMDTASQVLVATAIAVVFGIVIGIWAAESPRVEKALRPLLDTLQTLPQLVYIIPFIYLMPVSLVPGVVASVLYAIPVVIRLVTSGIRGVPSEPVEAAHAFGASRMQVLAKVKVPLAKDSIMLGVNQGLIMVLAVVVIGGLVGSGALGDQVARGLQRNEFGQGVVASLAILALGIALDRVTQGRQAARAPATSRGPLFGFARRRRQLQPGGGAV
jgi:glycine betaine/proline transport system permease protein